MYKKNNKVFYGLGIIFFICISPILNNIESNQIKTEITFLTIFPDARSVGMASAFTGISENGESMFYNLGALPYIKKYQYLISYSPWLRHFLPNMNYFFSTFIIPLKNNQSLGISFTCLTMGEFTIFDNVDAIYKKIRRYNLAIGCGYGKKLSENIGIGTKVKYVYLHYPYKMWMPSIGIGWGLSIDGSILYKINRNLSFGISLQNVGKDVVFTKTGEQWKFPLSIMIGGGYVFTREKNRIILSTSILKKLFNIYSEFREIQKNFGYGTVCFLKNIWKSIGVEYNYRDIFFVRGGHFWDVKGQRVGPTFGSGVRMKNIQLDIGIDSKIYSFKEDNYRFTVIYNFENF